MNKKQKIIVSVVGITIVLLALLGLTYAYFLTRIQGNTNTKSISVTTADLKLEYSDNKDVITGTNIVPGTTLPTKTFTVTNSGSSDIDSYSVGLVNVINTFTRLDDVKYTVTCSSSVTGKTCNGVSESTFPNENSYIIENQINKDEVQTYVIKVEYKEMNVDQSIDMGKTLEAKIDIFDTKSLTIKGTVTNSSENDYVVINSKEQTSEIVDGKYKFIGIEPDTHKVTIKNRKTTTTKQTTLNVSKGEPSASGSNITYNDEKNIADADITITGSTVTIDVTKISANEILLKDIILTNAKKGGEGRTIYSETPLTKPAEEINGENERTLSLAIDDYGNSYYFRGNVADNYVNFAGMCWRIVRISGDKSIKLILEDQNTTCESSTYTGNWSIGNGNFGYTKDLSDLNLVSNNSNDYNTKLLAGPVSPGGEILTSSYLNYLNNTDSSAMVNNFKNFQNNKLNKYLKYLKSKDWCLDDIAYRYSDITTKLSNSEKYENYQIAINLYYDSYVRLFEKTTKEPTLKCNGTNISKFSDNTDMYVGAITVDEMVYAGSRSSAITTNISFYLINDYQKTNSLNFWSLSPSIFKVPDASYGYDKSYILSSDGSLTDLKVNDDCSIRPSVTLVSGTQITGGDGTQSNPYIIK